MDRFFDRLGDVIKNFLDEDDSKLFGGGRRPSGDPDLDSAYEELDEFLKTGAEAKPKREEPFSDPWGSGRRTGGAWSDPRSGQGGGQRTAGTGSFRPSAPVDESEKLRGDFAELGVPFKASAEECKAAYKKLLKVHHPDRHAGHPGNMKKATEKSARINAAYQRIERWRETGKAE